MNAIKIQRYTAKTVLINSYELLGALGFVSGRTADIKVRVES